MLKVSVTAAGLTQEQIASLLVRAGISLSDPFLCYERLPEENRIFGWKAQWKGGRDDTNLPPAIQELAARPDVRKVELTR